MLYAYGICTLLGMACFSLGYLIPAAVFCAVAVFLVVRPNPDQPKPVRANTLLRRR